MSLVSFALFGPGNYAGPGAALCLAWPFSIAAFVAGVVLFSFKSTRKSGRALVLIACVVLGLAHLAGMLLANVPSFEAQVAPYAAPHSTAAPIRGDDRA